MLYISPPIWKLHPCSDIISELYKPAFHFLATCLMVVLQPSRYFVFYNRVTPVSVSTLKPPLKVIEVLTTETPSIFYTFCLYIRLVVTLQFASLIIDKDNLLLNSISSVQWQHINQHSLPSQTSSHHLKL